MSVGFGVCVCVCYSKSCHNDEDDGVDAMIGLDVVAVARGPRHCHLPAARLTRIPPQ